MASHGGIRQQARRRLDSQAYAQAGFFSASQACVAGYSYQAQKYHVDNGNWDRVGRGIFRLAGWPAGITDPYVCWTLWSGGRGVVSHATALTIHDLGTANPDRVHLTIPANFRPHPRPELFLHRATLPAADIDEREGYRITNVVRTILDVAAENVSQDEVDQAVADALDRGVASARRLRERSDEFGDRAALRIERALGNRTAG
jgi:predicted transcriptional regulator of viral defense system